VIRMSRLKSLPPRANVVVHPGKRERNQEPKKERRHMGSRLCRRSNLGHRVGMERETRGMPGRCLRWRKGGQALGNRSPEQSLGHRSTAHCGRLHRDIAAGMIPSAYLSSSRKCLAPLRLELRAFGAPAGMAPVVLCHGSPVCLRPWSGGGGRCGYRHSFDERLRLACAIPVRLMALLSLGHTSTVWI
jgi:hypothetical protein